MGHSITRAKRYDAPDEFHVHPLSYHFQILPYRGQLLDALQLLHEKTLSKRGFSFTGKLLYSLMETLTHTYTLENRFVNPEEWDSEGEEVSEGQDSLLTAAGRIPSESTKALGSLVQSGGRSDPVARTVKRRSIICPGTV